MAKQLVLEPAELDWPTLKARTFDALKAKGLDGVYLKRLKFEIDEIEKQGTNRYWIEVVTEHKKFDHNKNGLLIPWLIGALTGAADCDPLAGQAEPTLTTNYKTIKAYNIKHGKLPFDIIQDDDKPDIDIDCLPEARDDIKDYASRRYGKDKVASVGTWSTYLFKQAIQDVAFALDLNKERAIQVTRELPEDVNEMKDGGFGKCKSCGRVYIEVKCPGCGSDETESPTLHKIIEENIEIKKYINEDVETHTHVINTAARLVGKIRSMGKHAGAIIIADRTLFGNIPMSYDAKSEQWSSMWTEGRSTQLSKFGYNKWDILGLKNLKYIYECCKMIKKNYNISFGDRMEGWYDHIDPEIDQCGKYWETNDDGTVTESIISLNDELALQLANEQETDAVFQFDTDLAKRILSNGVTSFNDLMIFNAMGHPGPMSMIPDYVARRDDSASMWKKKENAKIAEILKDTHGTIVFQEQLQSLWQNIAGFTAPEAQSARKAVAKKWREKLKPIRQKWIDGAKKSLGINSATEWWDDRMESFGRYAFNKSHSVAYCLTAYQCLWLKAYFPEEWWAAVMSWCHPDRLVRYMNVARGKNVEFAPININHMTTRVTVHNKKVSLGLISLKKVGDSMCEKLTDDNVDTPYSYTSVDDFVKKKGKNKVLLERLIKLGSFVHLHPNIKATWLYYLFKHCTGKDVTQLKNDIRTKLRAKHNWNDKTIAADIDRQIKEFKDLNPKKKKIPNSILKFMPFAKLDNVTIDTITELYPDDYEFKEILEFEKEFLGYYWHSPADLYKTNAKATIENAKTNGLLHGVITEIVVTKTAKGSDMHRLTVNDGKTDALLILWDSDFPQPTKLLKVNAGIEARVKYDNKRKSFTLQRGTKLGQLWTKQGWDSQQETTESIENI